jgi:hypothetical protein
MLFPNSIHFNCHYYFLNRNGKILAERAIAPFRITFNIKLARPTTLDLQNLVHDVMSHGRSSIVTLHNLSWGTDDPLCIVAKVRIFVREYEEWDPMD